ncbi:hypothetical protein CI105_06800 [Candidatus Izimaplasma bacterium ZiA1]|uniref:arsenic resistance protein n=1 Tax=Candidatus Izimoplasma sp. ZiA1 TaxID=2024899 RepID=UPI000BAA72F3|nr:hypothetical protein CI105_06800 [Candidatus Izimaplasma bacterium ZiA1]
MKFLLLIKKNLVLSILISMLFGVVLGYLYDLSFLKQTILPLTFLLVYPMMITLNYGSLKEKPQKKLTISVLIINFIVIPALAYAIGILFFKDQIYIRLALLLISLFPTSGMSLSWTSMAKGNFTEAVKLVIISLFMGSLLSGLYVEMLLGESIKISLITTFSNIAIVIFIPMILGFITKKLLVLKFSEEVFNSSLKKKIPLFSLIALLAIIFVAISQKSTLLINNPGLLLEFVIPLIIFYGFVLFITHFVGKKFFNYEDQIALVSTTFVRNLSLALAIAIKSLSDEGMIAALFLALAYVIQVQFIANYIKFQIKHKSLES